MNIYCQNCGTELDKENHGGISAKKGSVYTRKKEEQGEFEIGVFHQGCFSTLENQSEWQYQFDLKGKEAPHFVKESGLIDMLDEESKKILTEIL